MFGYLVNQEPFILKQLKNGTVEYEVAESINSHHAISSVVVFKALSAVYFFSFLVSMLFYWGVLQWLVIKIGWLLQITIGNLHSSNFLLSDAEHLSQLKTCLNSVQP